MGLDAADSGSVVCNDHHGPDEDQAVPVLPRGPQERHEVREFLPREQRVVALRHE